jgi:hypothetical protein
MPRQSRSGNSPFAVFAWLAHVSGKLVERILSSPARQISGHPKGVGFERIRGAS